MAWGSCLNIATTVSTFDTFFLQADDRHLMNSLGDITGSIRRVYPCEELFNGRIVSVKMV